MLAINGGTPVRNAVENPWPSWPQFGEEEKELLIEVLESGVWSYDGPKEQSFVNIWKDYSDSEYALLVANGTVGLQLALEAVDIGFGDEVIVPGITWQATAAAVLDVNGIPILVDVEPDTWCMDPEALERAITSRTKAIIPVHLYGNMADMDAITETAEKHDLIVIEDAAHKHGGEWQGRKAGSLGQIGCFSLQLSKVLTAGEGGIITTSERELWTKLDALRNCGRRPSNVEIDKGAGQYGLEGDLIQSGNYRITEFQAAMLIAQFKRLASQNSLRAENARYLSNLLDDISGIEPMKNDERETKKVYFNYAFRFNEKEWNLPVQKFREALSEEIGFMVESCYQPLNDCTLYRPHTKKRYRINEEHWKVIDPSRFSLPTCEKVYRSEAVTLAHRLLMGDKKDMEMIADAITKISADKNSLTQKTPGMTEMRADTPF